VLKRVKLMVYVAQQEFEMFERHKFAKDEDLANLDEYLPMRKKTSIEADMGKSRLGSARYLSLPVLTLVCLRLNFCLFGQN